MYIYIYIYIYIYNIILYYYIVLYYTILYMYMCISIYKVVTLSAHFQIRFNMSLSIYFLQNEVQVCFKFNSLLHVEFRLKIHITENLTGAGGVMVIFSSSRN